MFNFINRILRRVRSVLHRQKHVPVVQRGWPDDRYLVTSSELEDGIRNSEGIILKLWVVAPENNLSKPAFVTLCHEAAKDEARRLADFRRGTVFDISQYAAKLAPQILIIPAYQVPAEILQQRMPDRDVQGRIAGFRMLLPPQPLFTNESPLKQAIVRNGIDNEQ